LTKVDRHRIKASEYQDAPEIGEKDLAKAKVVRRGRPLAGTAPKESVTMRLDREVLSAYRATGKGWQSRINADLQKAAKRLRA
jgi:uncharacterized protein (DUF4415 family)